MGKQYYVVRRGRETGIFKTWGDCFNQITGYKGAVYRGFNTLEEAEVYLAGKEVPKPANAFNPYQKTSSKVYAVRAGRKKGIFNTWDECRESIEGYKGAEYKSFNNNYDAEIYMGYHAQSDTSMDTLGIEVNTHFVSSALKTLTDPRLDESKLTDSTAIAYVDGSFVQDKQAYAYGCYFITKNRKWAFNGMDNNTLLLPLRNIAGEMCAAMVAVRFAKLSGLNHLTVVHDYNGLGNFAKHLWEAKNPAAKAYQLFMDYYLHNLNPEDNEPFAVDFIQVQGHSGVFGNDKADTTAKNAIVHNRRMDTKMLFEGIPTLPRETRLALGLE